MMYIRNVITVLLIILLFLITEGYALEKATHFEMNLPAAS
jgi:hypothetical protein